MARIGFEESQVSLAVDRAGARYAKNGGLFRAYRVRCAVFVLLLTAIAVIAQEPKREPPTPSKPVLAKANLSDSVSLSVDHVQEGESTKLKIRWQGQPAPSLLVVSVDAAHREEDMSQRVVHGVGVELTQFVFLRRIADQGDISIALSREGVRDFLGDGDWSVKVCVTKDIALPISIDDPSVKGGERVVRKERIDGVNGPSDLRFLAASHRAAPVGALFPGLKPFIVDVPENGFYEVFAEDQMLSAFLTFTVPVRSAP